MPERQYASYKSDCPFSFEYPTYAKVLKDTEGDAQPCWLNIVFPHFKGNLYVSYKELHGNLNQFIEECRTFVVKHEVKASAINERDVVNAQKKVYGLMYDIEGNAASNLQFYLTDSTKHFIRGALYFYSVPNKDSLEPVLNFVKQDILHLVESFRWKDSVTANPSIK